MSVPTLVTPEKVNALIAHGLPEEDLLVLIEREEERLAGRLGTPLVGPVTMTLRPRRSADPLFLPRMPAGGSVAVTDDDGVVEVDVDGAVVTRRTGFWSTPTTVEFELDDLAEVESAIIDLIRLALTSSPYLQESAEGHSATRSATVERTRAQIIAQLNPHRRRSVSVPM